MEGQKDLYACFIDCAEMFDRVKHAEMALVKVGVEANDIEIITELNWNQKFAIRVGHEQSEPAAIQRGVRQGCALPPRIFNICTKYVFRESNHLNGLNIDYMKVNSIRYVVGTTQ